MQEQVRGVGLRGVAVVAVLAGQGVLGQAQLGPGQLPGGGGGAVAGVAAPHYVPAPAQLPVVGLLGEVGDGRHPRPRPRLLEVEALGSPPEVILVEAVVLVPGAAGAGPGGALLAGAGADGSLEAGLQVLVTAGLGDTGQRQQPPAHGFISHVAGGTVVREDLTFTEKSSVMIFAPASQFHIYILLRWLMPE